MNNQEKKYILFSFNEDDLLIKNNFPTYSGTESVFLPNLTDEKFQKIIQNICKILLNEYKNKNLKDEAN